MGIKRKIIGIAFTFLLFYLAASFLLVYGKDPFMPLVDIQGRILIARDLGIESMSLEGVIYSEDKPLAIISGEVLKEKEKIGKYTVLAIEKEEVILEKDGQRHILKLEVD